MKTKRLHTKNQAKANILERERAPLIDHLQELKRRLFYVVVSVATGGAIAFALESKLITALLKPSHGQKFIYTSPMGGINFLFSVCIYIGVAISLPMIVYQFLQFVRPLMKNTTARFVFIGSAISGVTALLGITFGYLIGLPAALSFLFHSFHNPQVQALITIQAYMSFVTAYLFGSALMFQLPLFLIFINRIKPLKPSSLFKYERHVIVASIIIGFIMNPSPNILSQAIVVVPIILMYQVGIAFVWYINRHGHSQKFYALLSEDTARRAERNEQAAQLLPVLQSDVTSLDKPKRELGLTDAAWTKPFLGASADTTPAADSSESPSSSPQPVAPSRSLPRGQFDISPAAALASQLQSPVSRNQTINIQMTD